MKNKLYLIVVMILFMMPLYVKADFSAIGYSIYSRQAAVGSTIELQFAGSYQDLKEISGTLEYDPEILEFKNIQEVYTGEIGDCLSCEIEFKEISKQPGKIEYEMVPNSPEESATNFGVIAEFKVRSIPTTKKTKVILTPLLKNTLDDSKGYEATIDLVETTENANPVENNIEKCPVTKSNNDILLYASLATSGALLVALIIVIAKKKSVN